jgi:ribosomal protein L7/L12
MFNFLFSPPALSPNHVARLQRVERKLDLILAHLGIEYVEPAPGDNLSEQVRALADRGEKIQAIKTHRDLTGAGLAEAKRAVEAYLNRKP